MQYAQYRLACQCKFQRMEKSSFTPLRKIRWEKNIFDFSIWIQPVFAHDVWILNGSVR